MWAKPNFDFGLQRKGPNGEALFHPEAMKNLSTIQGVNRGGPPLIGPVVLGIVQGPLPAIEQRGQGFDNEGGKANCKKKSRLKILHPMWVYRPRI